MILIGRHQPRAHRAVGIERAGQVGLGAVLVFAADAGLRVGLELARRFLAHQVDGAGGAARATHQAIGAAHHFQPVIDGHVAHAQAVRVGAKIKGGYAVILKTVQAEAARIVVVALGIVVRDRHAGRLLQHVGQGGDTLVVHLLARNDGQRLRRLARRQHETRRRAGQRGRIGATVFRFRHRRIAGRDGDLGQLLLAARCRVARPGQRAQGKGARPQRHRRQAAAGQQQAQCRLASWLPARPALCRPRSSPAW